MLQNTGLARKFLLEFFLRESHKVNVPETADVPAIFSVLRLQ